MMKAIYLQLLRNNLQMIVIQMRIMSRNYLVAAAAAGGGGGVALSG
jgi:hypothetical protein